MAGENLAFWNIKKHKTCYYEHAITMLQFVFPLTLYHCIINTTSNTSITNILLTLQKNNSKSNIELKDKFNFLKTDHNDKKLN